MAWDQAELFHAFHPRIVISGLEAVYPACWRIKKIKADLKIWESVCLKELSDPRKST